MQETVGNMYFFERKIFHLQRQEFEKPLEEMLHRQNEKISDYSSFIEERLSFLNQVCESAKVEKQNEKTAITQTVPKRINLEINTDEKINYSSKGKTNFNDIFPKTQIHKDDLNAILFADEKFKGPSTTKQKNQSFSKVLFKLLFSMQLGLSWD